MLFRTSCLAALLCLTAFACSEPEPAPAEDDPIEIVTEPDEEEEPEVTEEEEPIEEEPVVEVTPPPEFVGVATLEDINPDPTIVEFELEATVTKKLVRQGIELELYTYNGEFPGPLLEANVGDTVIVHFTNNLPEATTIHWHGLRISDEMDGNPRIQDPVEPGGTFTYEFQVDDEGTYWYHPHVRAHVQVERGLYGTLVVHEPEDQRPRHDRERFFVLDDVLLDGDQIAGEFAGGHPELMHGRYGNAFLTNGSIDGVTATAKVGEKERWRLVNTANARTMEIKVEGARMTVYGNDGGRVEPYETDELLLPVGRRFDVEISYEEAGTAKLNQLVLTRNNFGQIVTQARNVAEIEVQEADADATPTEVEWAPATQWPERSVDREELVVLDAVQGGEHGVEWRINEQAHGMEPLFEFAQGETVKMEIRNMLGPEHPFHLHGQFFQIEGEPGVWDTVLVPGQGTVRITAFMDNPGDWMMHCHILEHAELGMMSTFRVE